LANQISDLPVEIWKTKFQGAATSGISPLVIADLRPQKIFWRSSAQQTMPRAAEKFSTSDNAYYVK